MSQRRLGEFLCSPALRCLGHPHPDERPAPRQSAGVRTKLARGARHYLRAHLPLLAAASCSSLVLPELPEARGSRNASRRWGCRRGMGSAGLLWISLALVTPGVLVEAERKGRDTSGAGMASVPRCKAEFKARRRGHCRMLACHSLVWGDSRDFLVLNVLTCASPGWNYQN